MTGGLQTVHVRVNDAATSKPTPVCIQFTDNDGRYYGPYGRLHRLGVGSTAGCNLHTDSNTGAYIDGTCEIGLPPGPLAVHITKGPEYAAFQQRFTLPPGKLSLRYEVARTSNGRANGWWCGDCRVMDLTPHQALLEGRAEDLAFVNLLAYETWSGEHQCTSNTECFSGINALLASEDTQVVVNTWNHHPMLGSLALLHAHRIIHPLTFGDPRPDFWTLADWCDQCRRKKGLVVWTELEKLSEPDNAVGAEALANALLGRIDAVELSLGSFATQETEVWYDLLNVGIRMPAVGASRKRSISERMGSPRTIVQCEPGLVPTYDDWIEGIRAGRTQVARNLLIQLTVNQTGIGQTIKVEKANTPIQACAVFLSGDSTSQGVELHWIWNGSIVGQDAITKSAELEYSPELSGWLAVAALDCTSGRILMHTSPVYVEIPGLPPRVNAESIKRLDLALARGIAQLDSRGRFETDNQREALYRPLLHARTALARRALRA